MKNIPVTARVSEEIKDKAQKVLEKMGLDVQSAIKIMLTKTAHEGKLPFEVSGEKKEFWISYLEDKIKFNVALIDNYKDQIREFKDLKAKQEADGVKFGVNYDLSIQNAEKVIDNLTHEIKGWQQEINNNSFKGFY